MMYWISFTLGYILSPFVSVKNVATLTVVVIGLVGIALGGVEPNIADIRSSEHVSSLTFLWYMSGAFWALEAYWWTALDYFKEIPSNSLFAGEPYVDITPMINDTGYTAGYSTSLW